jgi:pimeloyl-ACP methyl ester carboxylesterase
MLMTEFAVASDGVKLAFERLGFKESNNAPPVVLVHGFASSRGQNWKSTGWYASLTEAGFGVVAMDCRGHGESDKPHDEAFYGHERMAEDVAMVMDAAGIAAAALIGYSMGGFITLRLAAVSPERVGRLVLGGVGEFYLTGPRIADEASRARLSDALLTDDKQGITDRRGRMFRDFADQPGKDRIALAACMRAMSPNLPARTLAQVRLPVLVVCGQADDVAGPPGPLAAAFAQGRAVTIAGRDHMSAVGDRKTRQAAVEFLLPAQTNS